MTDASARPRATRQTHPDVPERVLERIRERRDQLQADLARLLAGRSTLTLEIGCGHGHYLTGYAAESPGEFCIGLDIIAERIERSNRKAKAARLSNLAFLKAEARETLDALPAQVLLTRVLLLFPDPWPKKRHHKNRILQPDFLDALAARCAPGARLFFRTDHEGYFTDGTATIAEHPRWSVLESGPSVASWPFELPTVFQQRASSHQSMVAEVR